MANNAGKTVAEILRSKKASVRTAALPAGSPSCDAILNTPWEEIVRKAKQRVPGYKTIRKLLTDREYDK